jgi:uncharacterized membrane protein
MNEKSNTLDGTEWARRLGWFSLGLGAAELLIPRQVGRFVGVSGHGKIIRCMGAREIATGIGILHSSSSVGSVAGRILGDVVDLALLGAALGSRRAGKKKIGIAMGTVAVVTALDVLCLRKMGEEADPVQTTQTVAINKRPEECYQFWRRLENLPTFMDHVESVTVRENGHSHWVVKAPAGTTVEWDAQLIEDGPEGISWRSLPGADVENSGSVRFIKAPAGHGTIVTASIKYKPPLGAAGTAIATLFAREPGMQAKSDLRRFKAMIETGEIPTVKGQSSGRVLSAT